MILLGLYFAMVIGTKKLPKEPVPPVTSMVLSAIMLSPVLPGAKTLPATQSASAGLRSAETFLSYCRCERKRQADPSAVGQREPSNDTPAPPPHSFQQEAIRRVSPCRDVQRLHANDLLIVVSGVGVNQIDGIFSTPRDRFPAAAKMASACRASTRYQSLQNSQKRTANTAKHLETTGAGSGNRTRAFSLGS